MLLFVLVLLLLVLLLVLVLDMYNISLIWRSVLLLHVLAEPDVLLRSDEPTTELGLQVGEDVR